MATQLDVRFNNDADYYDFSFDEFGDFVLTSGLDTSLTMTFLTNQRADTSEITQPENRGGWWGDLFADDGFEIGSKIWLLQTRSIQQTTLNTAIDYASSAYQWLFDQNLIDDLNVEGTISTTSISLVIETIIGSDISQISFNLWNNTNEF